jgi:hypothetical protein
MNNEDTERKFRRRRRRRRSCQKMNRGKGSVFSDSKKQNTFQPVYINRSSCLINWKSRYV